MARKQPNSERTLTGTKIAATIAVWALLLISFLIVYGAIRYGAVASFWQNLAYIISALVVMVGWSYGANEKRKRVTAMQYRDQYGREVIFDSPNSQETEMQENGGDPDGTAGP